MPNVHPETQGNIKLVLSALQIVVTWALVVFGWLIVSDQTQSREIAKNYYAELTRLRDALTKIEKSAVVHHTGEFDSKNVRQILRDISNFGLEISQLVKRKCVGVGANEYVANLRQAITRKNFDSSSFRQQEVTSDIVLNIEVAKDSFDRVLLESLDMISYRRRSLLESVKAILNRN
jgi:hypothetical protein